MVVFICELGHIYDGQAHWLREQRKIERDCSFPNSIDRSGCEDVIVDEFVLSCVGQEKHGP